MAASYPCSWCLVHWYLISGICHLVFVSRNLAPGVLCTWYLESDNLSTWGELALVTLPPGTWVPGYLEYGSLASVNLATRGELAVVALLGIPTGSCLHLPDCRQLPSILLHYEAKCAQCRTSCCAALHAHFASSALCITLRASIMRPRLLCPCATAHYLITAVA